MGKYERKKRQNCKILWVTKANYNELVHVCNTVYNMNNIEINYKKWDGKVFLKTRPGISRVRRFHPIDSRIMPFLISDKESDE